MAIRNTHWIFGETLNEISARDLTRNCAPRIEPINLFHSVPTALFNFCLRETFTVDEEGINSPRFFLQ